MKLEGENKSKLIRIIISAVLFVVLVVIQHTVDVNHWLMLGFYVVPYLISGYDILL